MNRKDRPDPNPPSPAGEGPGSHEILIVKGESLPRMRVDINRE